MQRIVNHMLATSLHRIILLALVSMVLTLFDWYLFLCVVEVEVGPVCPEGKVWMDCGTPCRLTCDNYERPPPCLPGCASGCFCPQGMVENGDECVLPSDCPPIGWVLHSTTYRPSYNAQFNPLLTIRNS